MLIVVGGFLPLARLEWLRSQIIAVEGQEVEAVGEHVGFNPSRHELIEVRHAIVAAEDDFSVDDGLEPLGLIDDAMEAARSVIVSPGEQPDGVPVAMYDQPEAVALQFVQPLPADRHRLGDRRRHGS